MGLREHDVTTEVPRTGCGAARGSAKLPLASCAAAGPMRGRAVAGRGRARGHAGNIRLYPQRMPIRAIALPHGREHAHII